MPGIIEGPFRYIVDIAPKQVFRKILSPRLGGHPSAGHLGSASCTLGSYDFAGNATLNAQGSPATTVTYSAPVVITLASARAVYRGALMRSVSISNAAWVASGNAAPAYFEAFAPDGTKLSAYAFALGSFMFFYGGPDWADHATVTIKAYRGTQANNDSLQPFPKNPNEGSTQFEQRFFQALGDYGRGPARTSRLVDPVFGETVLQSILDPDKLDLSNLYMQTHYGSAQSSPRKLFSSFTVSRTNATSWVVSSGVDFDSTYDAPQNFSVEFTIPTPPALVYSLPAGWARSGGTLTVPAGTSITSVSDRVLSGVHHLDITYVTSPGGVEIAHQSLASRDLNLYESTLNAAINRGVGGYFGAFDLLYYMALPPGATVAIDDTNRVSLPSDVGALGVDRIFFIRIVP